MATYSALCARSVESNISWTQPMHDCNWLVVHSTSQEAKGEMN